MKLEDKLTILIPTCNRKKQLLETLSSISGQGHWGEYQLVIVDNCSVYSVEDSLRDVFPEDFTKNICVRRWFFNTGMSTNISIAFQFVSTKWCWFLSDDDEILSGSLDIVLSDCKKYENYSAIKYSIDGICSYDNTTLTEVSDWANYYIDHNSGDKGYLAMLYNIEILYPYLSHLTIHSYTYLSFWIPIIRSIKETKASILMSSNSLYKYKSSNDGWSSTPEKYLNTLLGIRTLFDFHYGLSYEEMDLVKLMFSLDLFDCKRVIVMILQLSERSKRIHYYSLLDAYLVGGFFDRIEAKSFYYLSLVLDLSPLSINKLLNKLINKKK